MKNQALFSLKNKSKKLKCRLLQFLFCALRVRNFNVNFNMIFFANADVYLYRPAKMYKCKV